MPDENPSRPPDSSFLYWTGLPGWLTIDLSNDSSTTPAVTPHKLPRAKIGPDGRFRFRLGYYHVPDPAEVQALAGHWVTVTWDITDTRTLFLFRGGERVGTGKQQSGQFGMWIPADLAAWFAPGGAATDADIEEQTTEASDVERGC